MATTTKNTVIAIKVPIDDRDRFSELVESKNTTISEVTRGLVQHVLANPDFIDQIKHVRVRQGPPRIKSEQI